MAEDAGGSKSSTLRASASAPNITFYCFCWTSYSLSLSIFSLLRPSPCLFSCSSSYFSWILVSPSPKFLFASSCFRLCACVCVSLSLAVCMSISLFGNEQCGNLWSAKIAVEIAQRNDQGTERPRLPKLTRKRKFALCSVIPRQNERQWWCLVDTSAQFHRNCLDVPPPHNWAFQLFQLPIPCQNVPTSFRV
jgi:hypothetical protein